MRYISSPQVVLHATKYSVSDRQPTCVKRSTTPDLLTSNVKLIRVPFHSSPVSQTHSTSGCGLFSFNRSRYTVDLLKKLNSTAPPVSFTSSAHHCRNPCA